MPGARIVVQPEGARLPRGFWRVVSRVIRDEDFNRDRRPDLPVGKKYPVFTFIGVDDLPRSRSELRLVPRAPFDDVFVALDILLVAPMPSQHWWERACDRRLWPLW